jgi:hypothetical protein
MSGPFGSSQWMYNSGGSFYGYEIDDSLRFNDDDSAYLSRTPASAGNRKTWTFSAWIKLGSLSQGERGTIFSSSGGPTVYQDSGLRFAHAYDPAGTDYIRETVGLFRDPSAWYHVVWWCDTTQAGTRWKIYVNGTEQTLQTPSGNNGEPAQNTDLGINSTNSHTIGVFAGTYFDGYMADVNFIDGQALDATSFGELKSGIWIPKDTAGLTFGTNGFRLEYGDSAAIGDDTSGNTNDWTANNLVASDVVPDSPTNNFAVLNAVDTSTYCTLSEGNTKIASTSGAYWGTTRSTFAVDSGKWYWETRVTADQYARIGILGLSTTLSGQTSPYLGLQSDGYAYYGPNGYIYNNNSGSAYGASYTSGDVIGIALDLDGGTLTFYKNGTSQGTAATGLSGSFAASISVNTGSVATTVAANFGQDSTFAGATTAGGNADDNGLGDFKYAVPSGFLALCSANLPAPAIDPANDETPEDYFNTVLWTGDGSNPRTLSGLDFAADLIWHKSRSSASMDHHTIQDVVRGFDTNNNLYTSLTAAETTYQNRGVINSVSSTGFTFNENASDYSTADGLNENSTTFVAWNWKAGGTAVSNTDGSITSQVSADVDAGFSIVSYTGSTSESVGHGLGQAPEFIFVKDRDASSNWAVYHQGVQDVTANGFLELNTTTGVQTGSNPRFLSGTAGTSQPTSTVFYVNNYSGSSTNNTGNDYIAYCFHSVDGYSKVGSYIGNGSTDGPFIYTEFRPAWIMIKNLASGESWEMWDSGRDPYNVVTQRLKANTNGADVTSTFMDFVSNGVKCRNFSGGFNSSGATFIYLAFAEQPFKYANAR